MTTLEAQAPKRFTLLKLVLIIGFFVVLYVGKQLLADSHQNIKVTAIVSGPASELTIVNTGSETIEVRDVIINGRDDCSTYEKLVTPRLMELDIGKYSKAYLHRLWVANGDVVSFDEENGGLVDGATERALSTNPKEIKTGDSVSWIPHCDSQIVNATITTDKSSTQYTFR